MTARLEVEWVEVGLSGYSKEKWLVIGVGVRPEIVYATP